MLRASRILDPALEVQDESARLAWLAVRLRETVAHAYASARHFHRKMDEARVRPADVQSVADLSRIPVTRKDDVPSLQAADPPFGGLLGVDPARLQRIFASPGPILDPQGEGDDFWRFRMALAAAGFRAGDVTMNSSSYHLTPLGFMLDNAARSLGCIVVPAGVGQTDLQVRVAAAVRATAYLGTPSFLYTLMKRGRELGTPLGIEVAFVTAEMLPESLRSELETDFHLRVLQGYGTADLGLLAYECPEKGGMHLHPECILEVLDLESGTAAAPGQPGQLVATIFDPAYPLIRFATGDIGTLAPPAPCQCGRTAPKLAGLLGRVGDAVKVKGMFVRGSQMDEVIKRWPAIVRYQAVITREHHQDQLVYLLELASGVPPPDGTAIAEALREHVKVRGEVKLVPPGAIAPDAKRIDDRRVWK